MYHRYISPDEALDLFQKHLADHVENVKQHRFEFAHYEEVPKAISEALVAKVRGE